MRPLEGAGRLHGPARALPRVAPDERLEAERAAVEDDRGRRRDLQGPTHAPPPPVAPAGRPRPTSVAHPTPGDHHGEQDGRQQERRPEGDAQGPQRPRPGHGARVRRLRVQRVRVEIAREVVLARPAQPQLLRPAGGHVLDRQRVHSRGQLEEPLLPAVALAREHGLAVDRDRDDAGRLHDELVAARPVHAPEAVPAQAIRVADRGRAGVEVAQVDPADEPARR